MTPKARHTVVVATALLGLLLARGAGARADLAIVETSSLGFGQIVATSTPGTVEVTPAGNRSPSGGVALGNGFGVSAASFAVGGEPDTSYSISLPQSTSLTGGGDPMTVDGFASNPAGSGNLGPGGSQGVTVGATLHVGPSQSAGSYSGTYPVTVTYE